jgi:hypothetical protein
MAVWIRVCLLAAVCAAALTARAGELRLRNGAVIPGELVRADAAHLVWKADLLGDIRVPRTAVLALDSGSALALQSRTAPADHEDSGKLTVSLDLDRGDSSAEDQLDVDARAVRRRGQRRHTFEGSVDYEQDATRTTEDEAELLYQGDYLLRDGWFLYGLGEYRRDREAAIQESVMIGAGAGYEFRPLPELALRIQAGVNEVEFNIDGQGKELTEAGTVRWRGSWKTPWHDLELSHEGNYCTAS